MPVRWLRPLIATVCVVCAAGVASADKPKVAVLGLEATLDGGGVVDANTTRVAKSLTNGLRAHAQSTRSVYQLAPSSNKELIDEKLFKSCDSEKPDCMAPIGLEVNADFLIYGHVVKTTQNGVAGYRVQLKILDVKKRTEQAPWQQFIKEDQATADWAEEAYASATNEPKEVVIKPPPKITKDPGNSWKTLAWVSGGAAVVLAGGLVFSGMELRSIDGGKPFDTYHAPDVCTKETCRCSSGAVTSGGTNVGKFDDTFACKHGDTLRTMTFVTGIGAALAAGFTGIAIYKSSRAASDKERNIQGSREKRSRNFTVTPIVTPDAAGATVQLDW